MQTAMGATADAPVIEILVAEGARQSALLVSLEPSGGASVTLQPGGNGYLAAVVQHFLMALPPASRAAA